MAALVDRGKRALLDVQLTYLASLYWALFTTNVAEADARVLADLVEAAWTSYARVPVGSVGASAIVAGVALAIPAAAPVFHNGASTDQAFYGWGLLDASGTPFLVAYKNVGSTTIAAGTDKALTGAFTLTHP